MRWGRSSATSSSGDAARGRLGNRLTGEPLPKSTLDACLERQRALGAVGGPEVGESSGALRPERALLGIRKAMNLYANLRPARLMPVLKARLPLKEATGSRFDMLIVRELTAACISARAGGPGAPSARPLRHRSLRRGGGRAHRGASPSRRRGSAAAS